MQPGWANIKLCVREMNIQFKVLGPQGRERVMIRPVHEVSAMVNKGTNLVVRDPDSEGNTHGF